MLRAVNLVKRYGEFVAIDGVSVDFHPGRVTCVIGENGAGKSTLMKMLSGVTEPSSGHLELNGQTVQFASPLMAIRAGIAMVHQELNLIPSLSVGANIFLGREHHSGGCVNQRKESETAQALLREVGAAFSSRTRCGELSVAEQQLVEIAKAISQNPKFIIFDEPTAVLSIPESEQLFRLIAQLKEKGIGIIYISHRLAEVLRLADEIVVLRDGNRVGETTPDRADEQALAAMMVGRELSDIYPQRGPKQFSKTWTIRDLPGPYGGEKISFSVQSGEILGLGGLVGSGRTELAEAIVGLTPSARTIELDGRPVPARTFQDCIRSRIVYVSEDRKSKGVVVSMSVRDNVALPNLTRYSTIGKRKLLAKKWIDQLGIRTQSDLMEVGRLSGGNQQKVSLARWMDLSPGLIIVDEPTRGVDVGAKSEIYKVIADLADQGTAVIVISSDMPELIGLCQRVLVMREHRVVGELVGDQINETSIMERAAGVGA